MFDSLDIFNNNEYENTHYGSNSINLNQDIQQGIQFMNYSKEYGTVKNNNFSLLENTSAPNVGSIIEALNNGSDSTQNRLNVLQQELSADEAQLNTLLSAYASSYSSFSASLLKPHPTSADLAQRTTMEQNLNSKYQQIKSLADTIQTNLQELKNTGLTNPAKQHEIEIKMSELSNQMNEIQNFNIKTDLSSIKGQLETTKLNSISNHLHYLVFLITAITVIAFIMYLTLNPNANVTRLIYVVGALVVIYVISRWIL